MTTNAVGVATAADKAAIVDVLTLAFSADPASRWSWPEPRRYLEHFPQFVEAFGGAAFAQGSAHRIDGCAGAALWLPPGAHPDEEKMDALMRNTVPEEVRKDVFAVVEQMAGYHPKEPHWFLPFIGIDPSRQGRGLGAALLKHGLALCDRDGIAAYLDSSNPRNNALYERHGFELLGTIQIGSSPPIFPMLRKPRGGR